MRSHPRPRRSTRPSSPSRLSRRRSRRRPRHRLRSLRPRPLWRWRWRRSSGPSPLRHHHRPQKSQSSKHPSPRRRHLLRHLLRRLHPSPRHRQPRLPSLCSHRFRFPRKDRVAPSAPVHLPRRRQTIGQPSRDAPPQGRAKAVALPVTPDVPEMAPRQARRGPQAVRLVRHAPGEGHRVRSGQVDLHQGHRGAAAPLAQAHPVAAVAVEFALVLVVVAAAARERRPVPDLVRVDGVDASLSTLKPAGVTPEVRRAPAAARAGVGVEVTAKRLPSSSSTTARQLTFVLVPRSRTLPKRLVCRRRRSSRPSWVSVRWPRSRSRFQTTRSS